MKNLLSFKLFESSNLKDVVKDINDILLPIEDLGYTVTVTCKHFPSMQGKDNKEVRREVIKIDVTHRSVAASGEVNIDIIDALHQVLSYATSEGFHCNVEDYGDIKININNMKIVYTLKDLEALKSGKVFTIEMNLYRNLSL